MADREMLAAIKALLAQHKREIAGETANNMLRFKQEIVMGLSQHTKGLIESHMAQNPAKLPEYGQEIEGKSSHRSCVHILEREVRDLKGLAFQISEDLSKIKRESDSRPKRRRSKLGPSTVAKRQQKVRPVMAYTVSLKGSDSRSGNLSCVRCKSCGNVPSVRAVAVSKK